MVERLRAGDEAAFAELVRTYHPGLVRLAATFVPSPAMAEEVAQETWVGVVRGIGRFEGRSSLKTWIYTILVNRARTAGAREPRTVSLSAGDDPLEGRFTGGSWAEPVTAWDEGIEDRLDAPELAERVRAAMASLPEVQRQVVTLRDVEGLSSGEVCELLGLTEGNQRVLLHRARTKLRALFDDEFSKGDRA